MLRLKRLAIELPAIVLRETVHEGDLTGIFVRREPLLHMRLELA